MLVKNEKGHFVKGSGLNNLIGEKFGKLTVIAMAPRTTRKTFWECKCECGNTKTIRSDSLTMGKTKSCGCDKLKQDRINLTKNHRHKMSGTSLYKKWQGMIKRCYNPNNVRYKNYGGKGIKICDEWLIVDNFLEWALNNGYNDDLSIDRINVNGNYEPSNCRWATNKEQCNNRTTNILLTYNGETKTLTQWCEIFNFNYRIARDRYKKGKSFEEIFSK